MPRKPTDICCVQEPRDKTSTHSPRAWLIAAKPATPVAQTLCYPQAPRPTPLCSLYYTTKTHPLLQHMTLCVHLP